MPEIKNKDVNIRFNNTDLKVVFYTFVSAKSKTNIYGKNYNLQCKRHTLSNE